MELEETTAYKRKYFAFIDILGFSGLVKQTIKDKELFKKLHEVLKTIHDFNADRNSMNQMFGDMIDELVKGNPDVSADELTEFLGMKPDTENMVFSDSIVLSGSPDPQGLYELLFTISQLSLELLEIGIFIRGGVVIGEICFDASIVFGPALIDAYGLETNLAIYPRVLVADEIARDLLSIKPSEHPHAAGYNTMIEDCKNYLRQDFDGLYYVDFLSQPALDRRHKSKHWQAVEEQYYFEAMSKKSSDGKVQYEWADRPVKRRVLLEHFRSIIELKLAEASSDMKIAAKIRWIARYFNSVIEEGDKVIPIEV